jgi:hypothetical protein
MTRQGLSRVFAVLLVLIGGCTTSGSRAPTVTPPVLGDTANLGITEDPRDLTFSAGSFQYRLRQNTKVHAEGLADTTPSSITTTALLSVDVISLGDSAYDVTVSIDSLQMSTEGLIPSRSVTAISFLDPVLQAFFRGNKTTIETYLPDSLCAYSQFVTAARQVLLPLLPTRIKTPLSQVWVDTVSLVSCRAGSRIEMLVVQQISDLRREPREFALDERAELKGAGMLSINAVTVSGSIRTHGSISFTGGSRLPSLLRTESEGSITAQVGDSTMVFQQTTTQYIEQQETRLPN